MRHRSRKRARPSWNVLSPKTLRSKKKSIRHLSKSTRKSRKLMNRRAKRLKKRNPGVSKKVCGVNLERACLKRWHSAVLHLMRVTTPVKMEVESRENPPPDRDLYCTGDSLLHLKVEGAVI